MRTRTFRVYYDPGHAWVKVPKPFLAQTIGADWRKVFTCFSYERGEHVYLEEDEDAARLINWCRAASIEPVFKEGGSSDRPSRIRSYAPLAPC